MSERSIESAQQFVTCHCEHCDGGIEFDASDFEKGETRTIECPHCHLETIIFVTFVVAEKPSAFDSQKPPPVLTATQPATPKQIAFLAYMGVHNASKLAKE